MVLFDQSAQGKSLDLKTIQDEPDLVVAHLKARRAAEDQIKYIEEIGGKWCGGLV